MREGRIVLLQRARSILFEQGGLLALAVAGLYLWIAPHTIVGGDNADEADKES